MRIARTTALAVLIAVTTAALAPERAAAQTSTDETPIEATPKGTIGLGLLGAEVGFAIPAVAGLKDWYWYLLFPTIGAAGGAVGGWFGIDDPGHEKAAVGVLSAGLALVVPTMVLTLSMTAYDPEDEPTVIPADQAGEGPRAEARDRLRRAERLRRAGPGLVRRSEEGWLLTAPGVQVLASATPKERLLLGLQDGTEVRVPLLTGVF